MPWLANKPLTKKKVLAGGTTTWNPADKSTGIDLTNSDLTATHNFTNLNFLGVRTIGKSTNGKLYFESSFPNMLSWSVGFCLDSVSLSAGGLASGIYILFQNGGIFTDGVSKGSAGINMGDNRLRFAIDLVAKLFWVGTENGWGNGDPGAGTGGAPFTTSGNTHGYLSLHRNGSTETGEFGESFQDAVPSGFAPIPA